MTINTTTNRVEFAGDDVTTVLPFPYYFLADTDLVIIQTVIATGVQTTKTLTTHYTVTGAGNPAGGSVTMLTAPASTVTSTIYRDPAATQDVDLVEGDPLPVETAVERPLDKLTMLVQRVKELVARSLRLSDGDTYNGTLALPFDRALKYLAFDANKAPIASSGPTGDSSIPVSAFVETVLDDANGAAVITTLVNSATAAVARNTFGSTTVGDAVFIATNAAAARAALNIDITGMIRGLTYVNSAGDVTNDIDIAAGSCADSTGVDFLTLAAITKQSDVAWAVGTAAGGLDTGAVGNSDYYIWAIKRVDTGVVDVLFSLSATAPTMPTNYTLKRRIGWFKRVGGAVVAFTTYETDGGGLELMWTAPTVDVSLVNTLGTSRRTDVVKVPLNFSVTARLSVYIQDPANNPIIWIGCPDHADAGTPVDSNDANISMTTGNSYLDELRIRTSSAGLIAARSNTASVDLYQVSTYGFIWSRRN
jgi:hypothetical protein